jgi:transcriptional regulator with XRE-family HTH domain
MSPLLEEAQRVHDVAGLSDRTIAAATGAKPSTVRGWLAGRSEPTGARAERLIELGEMIRRLARVVRPESIAVWLNRPILALDDEKPIELIARGEYRRVAKLIAEIEYQPARTLQHTIRWSLAARWDHTRALLGGHGGHRDRRVVSLAG